MKTLLRSPKRRTQRSGANGKRKTKARVLFPQARSLTRQERLALNAYKNYLLRELPGQIERIILYGSKARGDGKPDSDLDLLIELKAGLTQQDPANGSTIWRTATDGAYDVLIERQVDMSPFFATREELEKWRPMWDAIQREGVEIWRQPHALKSPWPQWTEAELDEAQKEQIEIRWMLAEEKLKIAHELFAQKHWRDTISKAYYAMYYASKAMLMELGMDPHKHQGVISLVNQHIVRVGFSNPKYGKTLEDAFKARQDADYNFSYVPFEENATDAIRNAEAYLAEAKEILPKLKQAAKRKRSE